MSARSVPDRSAVPRWFDAAWALLLAFGIVAAILSFLHHHWGTGITGLLIAGLSLIWGLVLGPLTFTRVQGKHRRQR
jgi:steroid 5-alpha reductase family enzyme